MATTNMAEALTGAAVLAVAGAFLVYAGQTAGIDGGGRTYPLVASFRSLEGVSVGTDIRLAGVKVGTVTEIGLDAETYWATATLGVEDGILIPDDSAAVVASEGLLGGNFVEIVPGASFDNFAPGDEIIDTQGAVSLLSLFAKFASGGSGGDE